MGGGVRTLSEMGPAVLFRKTKPIRCKFFLKIFRPRTISCQWPVRRCLIPRKQALACGTELLLHRPAECRYCCGAGSRTRRRALAGCAGRFGRPLAPRSPEARFQPDGAPPSSKKIPGADLGLLLLLHRFLARARRRGGLLRVSPRGRRAALATRRFARWPAPGCGPDDLARKSPSWRSPVGATRPAQTPELAGSVPLEDPGCGADDATRAKQP